MFSKRWSHMEHCDSKVLQSKLDEEFCREKVERGSDHHKMGKQTRRPIVPIRVWFFTVILLLCWPVQNSFQVWRGPHWASSYSSSKLLYILINVGKNGNGLISFFDKENSANGPFADFSMPQILQVLFKFMLNSEDFATREQLLRYLQKLLEAILENNDCFISEHGWQAWFLSFLSIVQFKKHQILDIHDSTKVNEAMLIRSIFLHCLLPLHLFCKRRMASCWTDNEFNSLCI